MTGQIAASPLSEVALSSDERLVIGVDIGSTTVKTVAISSLSRSILWQQYQRHETRQAATVRAPRSARRDTRRRSDCRRPYFYHRVGSRPSDRTAWGKILSGGERRHDCRRGAAS